MAADGGPVLGGECDFHAGLSVAITAFRIPHPATRASRNGPSKAMRSWTVTPSKIEAGRLRYGRDLVPERVRQTVPREKHQPV